MALKSVLLFKLTMELRWTTKHSLIALNASYTCLKYLGKGEIEWKGKCLFEWLLLRDTFKANPIRGKGSYKATILFS